MQGIPSVSDDDRLCRDVITFILVVLFQEMWDSYGLRSKTKNARKIATYLVVLPVAI